MEVMLTAAERTEKISAFVLRVRPLVREKTVSFHKNKQTNKQRLLHFLDLTLFADLT